MENLITTGAQLLRNALNQKGLVAVGFFWSLYFIVFSSPEFFTLSQDLHAIFLTAVTTVGYCILMLSFWAARRLPVDRLINKTWLMVATGVTVVSLFVFLAIAMFPGMRSVALIIGACLVMGMGQGYINLYWGSRLTQLDRKTAFLVLAAANAILPVLVFLGRALPTMAALLVLVALSFPCSWALLGDSAMAPSAEERHAAEERSVRPLVRFILSTIAFGFACGHQRGVLPIIGGTWDTVLFVAATMLGAAIVVAFAVTRRLNCNLEILFKLALVLTFLGTVLFPMVSLPTTIASVLLTNLGCTLFSAVSWLILAEYCKTTDVSPVTVFASALPPMMISMSAGGLLGYWMITNPSTSSNALSLMSAAISVLLLVSALWLFPKSVTNAPTVAPVAESLATAEKALAAAAGAKYDLTPREEEIVAMLIEGRNVPYIENALVLSKSTVKTHIRHVFTKMDVHSTQELVEAVRSLQ